MTDLLCEIPVTTILVNPDQPRAVFNKKSLDELAVSIKNSGLLYPVIVEGPHQPTKEIPHEFYILIDGERRLRAIRSLGRRKVKALVNDPEEITRDKRMSLALIANLQREDLNPIEVARGLLRLKTELGLNNSQIARRTGFSNPLIISRLQMLELEEDIQDLIAHGDLQKDKRLIDALLTVTDSEKRVSLAKSLASRGASVKAGVEACARLNQHIRAKNISRKVVPSIRIAEIKEEPMPMPKYDIFVASGVVPKWELVKEAAKTVCDECAMRSIASDVVCKECPLAEFLINLTRKVKRVFL